MRLPRVAFSSVAHPTTHPTLSFVERRNLFSMNLAADSQRMIRSGRPTTSSVVLRASYFPRASHDTLQRSVVFLPEGKLAALERVAPLGRLPFSLRLCFVLAPLGRLPSRFARPSSRCARESTGSYAHVSSLRSPTGACRTHSTPPHRALPPIHTKGSHPLNAYKYAPKPSSNTPSASRQRP